jgi:hypothetical protein
MAFRRGRGAFSFKKHTIVDHCELFSLVPDRVTFHGLKWAVASVFKADGYRRVARIAVGLSLSQNYSTTFRKMRFP